MDESELIQSAVNHPAVIQANTRPDAAGNPVVPTPAELELLARLTVKNLVAELLCDPALGRSVYSGTATLSITSGTTVYKLDKSIGRILNLRISDTSEPLTLFAYATEFDDWRYRNYSRSVSVTDQMDVAYISGYDVSTGQWELTFFPGTGGVTSILIRYVGAGGEPYDLSQLPEPMHAAVEVGLFDRMTGSRMTDEFRRAKKNGRRALGLPATARAKRRYPRDIQCRVDRINDGLSSSSLYYPDGYRRR